MLRHIIAAHQVLLSLSDQMFGLVADISAENQPVKCNVEGAKAAINVVVQKKRKAYKHATDEAKKAAKREQTRQTRQKRRNKQTGKQKQIDDLQKENKKMANSKHRTNCVF